jgi:hypothetical protein
LIDNKKVKLINKIEIKNANPRNMGIPDHKQKRYEPYRHADNNPEANKFREFFRPISKIEKSSQSSNTNYGKRSGYDRSTRSRDRYTDRHSKNEKLRSKGSGRRSEKDRGRDDDDAVDLTAKFKR